MLKFGERIKNLRLQKKLTQAQLAKRLWVTKSIISAYEANTRYPSLDMLIKLAYTFNVTTDYLLGVDKKQYIEISALSEKQISIIRNILDEFKQLNS